MTTELFRVAGFEVQPSAGRIVGPRGEHRLEPKVMSVLEVLAERAGQVVAKSDFMSRVWPGISVSDDALVRCVSRLRLVFGDTATDPRVIETIPKKGYRLVAPVSGRWILPIAVKRTLEAVLASCSDHIYVYDREAKVLFVSDSGARAVGLEPADMIGRSCRDLGMPAPITEPFESRVASVFESKRSLRDTVSQPALFGCRRYEYLLDPILAGGEVVAVIALIRDVTERL